MISSYFLIELFGSILIFAFAIYSFKRGRERKLATNFAFLLMGMASLILTDSFLHAEFTSEYRKFIYYLYNIPGGIVTLGVAMFFKNFPTKDKYSKFFTYGQFIFTTGWVIYMALVFSGIWVVDVTHVNGAASIQYRYPQYSRIWDLFIIINLLSFFLPLFFRYKNGSGIEKTQLRLFIIGSGLSTVTAIIIQPILPWITGENSYLWLYPFSFTPFFALTLYSIIKYRFMDLRLALRIIVYRIITVNVILFIILLIYVFNQLLFPNTNTILILLEIIFLTYFIVFIFEPITKFIENSLDTYLFSRIIDSQHMYQKLNSEISQSINLDFIIENVKHTLSDLLNVTHVDILEEEKTSQIFDFFHEKSELLVLDELLLSDTISQEDEDKINWMKKHRTQIAVPIVSFNGLIAVLVLGEKKDNDAFYENEIQQLQVTSNHLASVIENAKLFSSLQEDRETIENEREKLSFVLSNIQDGVLALDQDGYILFINKATEELVERNNESILKKHFDEIISLKNSETQKSTDFASFQNLNENIKLLNEIYILTVSDNQEKYVTINVAITKTSTNNKIKYIFMLHDLTEQRQLEMMKLDFVSMAAHELRTPLTSVRGYAEWLNEATKSGDYEKIPQITDRLLTNATDLNNLIDNLLNVTQIENGELKTNIRPVQITDLIEKLLDSFLVSAQNKNQTLTYIPPQKPIPLLLIDEFRINEVFKNLISNAIKYTHPGGKITITIWKDDDFVYSQIKDNGQGIPKSAIPYLFTKFYRVQTPLEAGSKGTGLGLFISSSIIKLHDGDIWVESEIDQGTAFTFKLPIPTNEQVRKAQAGISAKDITQSKSAIRFNPSRNK